MGIHGIYKEIGAGLRIALSKVAVEHFAKTGRPLRIAIDTSIWLFQIQSSKGGTNPALRTFYYRLLRLISLSIHPLFVFDGPNKPPFKRNRRTGPNVASIPEFLAKQLLKQFGLPFHLAPGEAEAECALLQREGIVDAVLSEDVDTLMFGSGITYRSWTPEAAKSKVPTHINLYDAKVTKATSGMDREGMILVALMSGGDYVPEGIPGCGPKTACEAARAGFGHDLCQISRRDKDALRAWKDRLAHELHTNESKLFNRKHGKLAIPDDFPNPDVLGYYTHPVISSREKIARLERELKWDMDIDFKELRTFTGDAFDWTKLGGAKKFIRNLAPALLVRELRMQGEALARNIPDDARPATSEEEPHVKGIHGKRNHASTDNVTELRVTFTPHELVPIDLGIEEPDDEINNDSSDDEGTAIADTGAPGSPSKKRGPYTYDPTDLEKLWVFETYVRAGAPLTVKDWEDRAKNTRILVEARHANREAKRAEREKASKTVGDMQEGALDRFATIIQPDKEGSSRVAKFSQPARKPRTTKASQQSSSIKQFAKVTKAGALSTVPPKSSQPSTSGTLGHRWLGNGRLEVFHTPDPEVPSASQIETIDLLSSPAPDRSSENTEAPPAVVMLSDVPDLLPPTVTKRRRSPLRRWATDMDAISMSTSQARQDTASRNLIEPIPASPSSLPSPSQLLPAAKRARVPNAKAASSMNPSTPRKARSNGSVQTITILSSPTRQANLYDYFSPSRRNEPRKRQDPTEESPAVRRIAIPDEVDSINLTGSPTPRRRLQSPENPQLSLSNKSAMPLAIQQERLQLEITPSLPVIGLENPVFRIPSSTLLNQSASTVGTGRSQPLASQDLKKAKAVYRVRESLPGSFAIEAIDMTNDAGTANVKVRKRGRQFRTSEVSILDLTSP